MKVRAMAPSRKCYDRLSKVEKCADGMSMAASNVAELGSGGDDVGAKEVKTQANNQADYVFGQGIKSYRKHKSKIAVSQGGG